MASGYHGLIGSLSFPGEEQREAYAAKRARAKPGSKDSYLGAPNPLFETLFNQLTTQLDPRVQRTRLRRQFGRYSDQVARSTQGAMDQLNASYARRGLGGSGIAARAQGGLAQNQAYEQAQLPGLYQEALGQQQQGARSEALNFLLQILQERRGATQANEAIEARKNSGKITARDWLSLGSSVLGGAAEGYSGTL